MTEEEIKDLWAIHPDPIDFARAIQRKVLGVSDEPPENNAASEAKPVSRSLVVDQIPAGSSWNDATICAEAVLDLRAKLLHLIKHEGMANDHFTDEMYQMTTDALFAASRIKGASK
jgi:hypothetical protein